jgi:flagellar hook-length control protein FliK
MARRLQTCDGLFAPNEVSPVPSVASEVAVQSSKRAEPMPNHLNSSARTPSTPFDAVLDATASSPPPRAERPERQSAPDRTARADDAAQPRDPSKPEAPAPRKTADSDHSGDTTPAKSDPASATSDPAPVASDNAPVPDAAAVKPEASPQPAGPVVADKDEAKPDNAEPAAADDTAQAGPVIAAPTPGSPVPVLAAIAVPAVVTIAADTPATTTDGAAQPVLATAAPDGGTEPARAQSLQVAVAADVKNGLQADETAPKAASTTAAATVAEATQPGAPAAAAPSVPSDDKPGKPKIQSGRSERAAAPARAAAASVEQPTDKRPDAPEKPAAPVVHGHEPAADRAVVRATLSEPRDTTLAPATMAPAQANANRAAINPSASVPAMPTLWPVTALRVDTRSDVAVPVAGLAVEIVSRAEQGLKRFDIRLDPPDLGRIDVRLDVDHDGRVTSRLIVERADTLDLLRRDAPQLERALQQAGLKTDGGIDFSLRDQSFRDQAPRDNAPMTRLIIPDDEPAATDAVRGYGRLIGLGGGVDIRV